MGKEVSQTFVDVEAILDERKISLGEVVNLKIGSTVLLNATPDDPIVLKCGGVDLTTGRLGRVGDTMAISLIEDIRKYRQMHREN